MSKTLKITSLVCVLVGLVYSCSTEKDAALNRGYHNMTAHYNGYFNAGEKIKESLASYEKGYQEDFETILPVYIYPGEDDAASMFEPMNVAIEKTTKVINRHAMPMQDKKRKNEEWCAWIDDNYFVMGKAEFFKKEYKQCENLFGYIKVNYPKESSIYEASLWLAKTYIEQGKYADAETELQGLETLIQEQLDAKADKDAKKEPKKDRKGNKIKPTPQFPKKLKDDLAIIYADMYLRKKDYANAKEKLVDAIDITRNKKMKTRLTYILAQIHEELGDNQAASATFDKVTKMTAPYEMEFYAKIKRALLYNGSDTKGLKAELKKMLEDEKNKDYLDQIYYALAGIELKEDNKEQGIKYLELSAANSTTNKRQKSKTYIKLADINYDDKEFRIAKTYYDSCVSVIDDKHPDYVQITDRSEGLTALVKNLEVVETQDSLLNLVAKGEKYYLKEIDKIIEAKREEDRLKSEERMNSMNFDGPKTQDFGDGANWYFYNPQAKSFGYKEFKKIWGDRKLEDDWRRKNKNSVSFDEFGNGEGTETVAENDPYAPEFYIKDLPLTAEQVEKSNKDIAEGLYNLGVIYKNQLNEPERSAYYFEELVKRYKENENALPGMYQLYLMYKDQGKHALSQGHKTTILSDYPRSEYARIINNPNYKKEEEALKKVHGTEYEQVYTVFARKDFDNTITKCNEVIARREENSFIPKYLLLKANALGSKKAALDDIKIPLTTLVKEHKDTDEGLIAAGILERLRNKASLDNAKAGNGTYIYNAGMEHFFVLIFPNNAGKIKNVTSKISNMNSAKFGSKGLKIKNTFINSDNQIVVVRSFDDKKAAMVYYNAYKNDNKYVNSFNSKYECFVITHKNYAAMFLEKDYKEYLEFFNENYN